MKQNIERQARHTSNTIVSRRCICCGFEIKPIHGGGEDKPWQGMWLDGTVDKIAANYGSELDGDMYVVALCDSCVRSKLKEGIIEYVGNYMERYGREVKTDIDSLMPVGQ